MPQVERTVIFTADEIRNILTERAQEAVKGEKQTSSGSVTFVGVVDGQNQQNIGDVCATVHFKGKV
jgi:hypothetical protein